MQNPTDDFAVPPNLSRQGFDMLAQRVDTSRADTPTVTFSVASQPTADRAKAQSGHIVG